MKGNKKLDSAAYDKTLQQRGSLNFWFSDEAIDNWYAEPTGRRGTQPTYSDLAIETTLLLGSVFHQPLRKTEGFLNSIFELTGTDLKSPDHSTLSRRSQNLKIPTSTKPSTDKPLDIVIDSTGLKIYGAGE